MFVATNRLRIKNETCEKVEGYFSTLNEILASYEGFVRLRLLKTHLVDNSNQKEYLLQTEWTDTKAFSNWKNSQDSRFISLKENLPTDALIELENSEYELCLDEGPGTRVDCRSSTLDQIVEKQFVAELAAQKKIRQISKEKNLPPIQIGPLEGQILEILLRILGAQVGVEIGTLGGYSASWLLRGLSAEAGDKGFLHTLEIDPERAQIARENLQSLELPAKFQVYEGPALETLNTKLNNLRDLDFVFVDADKPSYPEYISWALTRLRDGGLLICDNAYIQGGMYFYGRQPTSDLIPASGKPFGFTLNRFRSMSRSWDLLSQSPDCCSIILPTGEGLGLTIKKPKVWQK